MQSRRIGGLGLSTIAHIAVAGARRVVGRKGLFRSASGIIRASEEAASTPVEMLAARGLGTSCTSVNAKEFGSVPCDDSRR